MKKLLLVNPAGQFGHHSITYHYCKYLSNKFKIVYICWDYGYAKIEEDFVNVIYVSRNGSKFKRLFRFFLNVLKETNKFRYDVVYVVYFRMCSLLRVFMKVHPTVLDIRTGYIGQSGSSFYRKMNNKLLYLESLFYRNITILSESLRDELRISPLKCRIVPLGAEGRSFHPKDFKKMNLLYVGTFNHRCIEKTIEGFAKFYKEMKNKIKLSYEIIGYGSPEQVQAITDAIERNGCSHIVKFHGRIPHQKLYTYLDRNNVGIAYVPMVDQYQCQPTTKIFEYHLSGMPVLATATYENTRYVNSDNGVLVNDDVIGVYQGLMRIYQNLSKYDSEHIKSQSAPYTWEAIISCNLEPYISSLMERK